MEERVNYFYASVLAEIGMKEDSSTLREKKRVGTRQMVNRYGGVTRNSLGEKGQTSIFASVR